ncbi:MAG: gliding motility-associated C-terminal domain-containing protein, partial [Saprospiraceae bacterium]|nr:gliding motility-associated C-terminal domain-containing protein [Saprospiraceae bacterium]
AALGGCDSILQVQLAFTVPDTVPIRWELCPGDTLIIGGIPFHAGHLQDLVAGNPGTSCDTLLDVKLHLFPNSIDTIPLTICPGDTVDLLGNRFQVASSSKLIRLPGQSASGCDSSVFVQVLPRVPSLTTIRDTLCPGNFRMIAGERFDEFRPAGTLSAGQDVFGCDSLLDILITFLPVPLGHQDISLCPGEIVEVAGVFFSENHLVDTVQLVGESAFGCDSLVYVTATLLQPTEAFLEMDFCIGSELVINGRTYDQNNPSGMEILPGANVNGCDSIIHIDLHFTDAVHSALTATICPGDFIMVDTVLFDSDRPQGSVLLTGASQFGCDSIVDVTLQVVQPTTSQYVLSLCPGEFLVVNGNRYDTQHPSGTEVLMGANQFGCDSIVDIALTFDTLLIDAQATREGCQPGSGKTLMINQLANGHGPYRFSINGGNFQGIPSLPFRYPVPDTTTMLLLLITDQSGCEASVSISFADSSAQAVVSLGPDQEILLGEPVTLELTTNVSLVQYTLYAPDGTSCRNCLPKAFDLMQTGAFRLLAEDAQGCTYADDVNVIVAENSRLFIPNIFSPNGDGRNDDLRLYPGSNLVIVHAFIIRDAWGETVFEAHDYYPDAAQPAWDGTLKGKSLQPGVFTYFVQAEFINGKQRTWTGDISLVR